VDQAGVSSKDVNCMSTICRHSCMFIRTGSTHLIRNGVRNDNSPNASCGGFSHRWASNHTSRGTDECPALACASYCVQYLGGYFVLGSKSEVYRLDNQEKVRLFAGRRVNITGNLESRETIHVVDHQTRSIVWLSSIRCRCCLLSATLCLRFWRKPVEFPDYDDVHLPAAEVFHHFL
jgi:hypothetical protein